MLRRASLAPLRRGLRPWIDRARRLRARLTDRVRPPRPWDGRHHPILERFPPWEGVADGRLHHDFLGARTDPRFRVQFRADPPGLVRPAAPIPGQMYFELVFVLEAVVASVDAGRRAFTMMELGAGYGPWLVTAHCGLARLGGSRPRLIGVEMDPRHFEWMREHLRTNGVASEDSVLVRAAVSDGDAPGAYVPVDHPVLAYGQHLIEGAAAGTPGAVTVERIDLRRLLESEPRVDLLHMDVQGEEWRALHRAGQALARVERLVVATHSRMIHRRLRAWLPSLGFRQVLDFRYRTRERTAFGDIWFLDGLQAWIRPERN